MEKMFQTTNQHSTNMDLFHESWILGLTEINTQLIVNGEMMTILRIEYIGIEGTSFSGQTVFCVYCDIF